MKVSLGYYNDLTVFLSTIFRELDFKIDYIGKPSKKTLELATKYSPESWCFDAKLIFARAIEGIKNNDDLIVIPGAWGGNNDNCLVGYLTKGIMKQKLENIFKKKINIWFFNINPGEIMASGYTAAYDNLFELKKFYKGKFFRSKLIKATILGTQKMKLCSRLKETILISPDVVDKDKLFFIYDNFVNDLMFNCDNSESADKCFNDVLDEIKKMKRKNTKRKLKIGLVGDFAHTLFSFFPFFDLEKFLVTEEVSVYQPVTFFNYYNFFSSLYEKKNREKLKKLIPQKIAGSDVITILSSLSLKDKVDGLVHIRAFGCTPEEVANEVLISNKKLFPPILSLAYDDHTTEENLKVRIEAFIDMLEGKKK